MKKWDLFLKASVENDMGYSVGITKTFPIGERIIDLQKAIYQIILDAHLYLCCPEVLYGLQRKTSSCKENLSVRSEESASNK